MPESLLLPAGFNVKDFSSLPAKQRLDVAQQVARLEKKVFGANESFDYDIELKKKNIGLKLILRQDQNISVVAYLVSQRLKRLTWLHKLCVVENERGRGLGRFLLQSLRDQLERGGCSNIYLWVDESNGPARALYGSCGFQQIEYRADYYSTGRAGLKLELILGE